MREDIFSNGMLYSIIKEQILPLFRTTLRWDNFYCERFKNKNIVRLGFSGKDIQTEVYVIVYSKKRWCIIPEEEMLERYKCGGNAYGR